MKNNWQKDIHDRLGNYEKDAPKGLWENLQIGFSLILEEFHFCTQHLPLYPDPHPC